MKTPWSKPTVPAADVERMLGEVRPVVPLDRALLCLDCESIFTMSDSSRCPACGSGESWVLGRALAERRAS